MLDRLLCFQEAATFDALSQVLHNQSYVENFYWATQFLDYMRRYTRVTDPVFDTTSLTDLQSLSRDEQRQKLRDLAIGSEIIASTYIARQFYGLSMEETKQMVDELLIGQQRN